MADSGRGRLNKRSEARCGEGEFLRLAVVGVAKRKSEEMLTHPGSEEAGGEPAELGVGPTQRNNHEERRRDKGDTDERRTEQAVVHVAEVNAECAASGPGII